MNSSQVSAGAVVSWKLSLDVDRDLLRQIAAGSVGQPSTATGTASGATGKR